MKIFVQLEGDCNGVFVTEKSRNGFKVKELNNGKSNVSFSWNLVANRADVVDKDGTIASKHVDVRFPIGPKKLDPEKQVERNLDEYQPVEISLEVIEKNWSKFGFSSE